MAFVFQTQRWKHQSSKNQIGPGHYNAQFHSKTKCGVITPDYSTTNKQILHQQSNSLNSGQQNIKNLKTLENNKTSIQQSSKKIIRRTMSAKPGTLKKQFSQTPTIFKSRDLNLQITNSNNHQKKSFQNSIIKTSFKKTKKSIHSQVDSVANKKLFNDKNLRTLQSNNSQIDNQKLQNIQFFNTMFSKGNSNPKLAKFVQNTNKTQNVFVLNDPTFMKQKQNFIIASGNCKKETLKPSYSSTPTAKDTCSFSKLDAYEDIQTTGIQDSFQSSIEYIEDTTPGPGQYQLRKDKPSKKSKVQKFGITQKRFKESINRQKILNLNIKIPCFKKSTKASQQKVGFGKNRPQTAKQSTSEFLFYEDHHTIQNRCLKDLIKDRQAPGTFMSRGDRFRKYKRQVYFGPDFFQKDRKQKISLPNSIFMSKVDRHQRPLSPTAEIDFEGQNWKTIQQKAQKMKQKKELVDGQTPGFYVSESRFKYKVNQQNCEIIKKTSGSEINNKKQLKSFTFRKDEVKNNEQIIYNPAPWTYNVEMKWLKPSHHVRYKF